MECYAAAAKTETPFWTVEKEARLIGLYSKFGLLWDTRHEAYYKRDQRKHAWRAIARGLDNEFEVQSVKAKIKSLRDYFVKELNKEEGMRQSGYVSHWAHFESWAFLRRAIRAAGEGQQVANMPHLQPMPPTCTNNEPSWSMDSDDASDASGHPIRHAAANSTGVTRMAPETENPAVADNSSRLLGPDLYENDTDAFFCRRVLSGLRQLPSYKRDLTKLRIERILFEAKYMTEQRAE